MVGGTVSLHRAPKMSGSGGLGTSCRAEKTRLRRGIDVESPLANLTRDRYVPVRFPREARAASAPNPRLLDRIRFGWVAFARRFKA